MNPPKEPQPVGMTEAQRSQLELIRQVGPGIEQTQMIKALAQECRVPVAAVEAELNPDGNRPAGNGKGRPVAFGDPDPWPDPIDGAELLDEIATWLRSFLDMSKEQADSCALWVVDTWCVKIAEYAPLLIITAPTKQSGKTRLLGLNGLLVRRPHLTSGVGVSAAVIFRLNEEYIPTFLIDEAERLRGDGDSRDIISLLNNGYEPGGKVSRCSGDDHEVRTYDAFGFRALAAIGDLADTLMDRAIVVRLKRKPKGVEIRRAPARVVKAEAVTLARKIARWTADNLERIEAKVEAAPRPDWLDDRAADKWSGLFAIAAVAGGEWPERALAAARALSAGEQAEDQSAGVALLRFIRRLLTDKGTDRIETAEITRLAATDDEAPSGRGGRDLTDRDVARFLKPFGIRSKSIRLPDGRTPKGYRLEDLQDAFSRYLEPLPLPEEGLEAPQAPQGLNDATSGLSEKRHTTPAVADREQTGNPRGRTIVADVADEAGDLWEAEV